MKIQVRIKDNYGYFYENKIIRVDEIFKEKDIESIAYRTAMDMIKERVKWDYKIIE